MHASASRNALDKMLSASAVKKSESPSEHALAIANLDELFADALLGWSKPDRESDPHIGAIHRLCAPMRTNNRMRLAKLTLKEYTTREQGVRLNLVEAVEVETETPAALWVEAATKADGIAPQSILSAGAVRSLSQRVEDFNRVDPTVLSRSVRTSQDDVEGVGKPSKPTVRRRSGDKVQSAHQQFRERIADIFKSQKTFIRWMDRCTPSA